MVVSGTQNWLLFKRELVSHLYYVVGGTHSLGACSFFGAAAFTDGFTLYFLHGARCAAANPTSLLLADLV